MTATIASVASSTDRRQRSVALVLTVLLGCAAGAVGAGAGTAVAGDQVAIVWTEPEEVTAEPGETVDLEVVLQSEGGHGDAGVERVTLVTQYDPTVLAVTDVERGPWLEDGDADGAVETAGTIANDEGTAILEQAREGGATGVDTLATLSVQVAEDAPAGTTNLEYGASDAALESEWPMAVVGEATTVTVDGDGEDGGAEADTAESDDFEHPDPDDLSLEDGFGGADTTSDDADLLDSVPGFTTVFAVSAIAVVALVAAVVSRIRPG